MTSAPPCSADPLHSGADIAFVLGAARSGTTLIRMVLDAHPEIGCPAEAALPSLAAHLVSAWRTVDADAPNSSPTPFTAEHDAPSVPPDSLVETDLADEGLRWVRQTITTPMWRYLTREKKRVYVDKSLDSVDHTELLGMLFPQARYVLISRHVMDTIASGLEASPWGFQAFGYGPYVQGSAHNFVAPLATYWLNHMNRALSWEKEHPELCVRVRYEDFVADPHKGAEQLFGFLGVSPDSSAVNRAFARSSSKGPGDYKIHHTTAVHQHSVGRGKRVPVSLLPPALLEALNATLMSLGYEALDASWNTTPAVAAAVDAPGVDELGALMTRLAESRRGTPSAAGAFALIADDDPGSRWVISRDGTMVVAGDGEVDAAITGSCEDLVSFIEQRENPGVLLRSGRIRHIAADGTSEDDSITTANEMIALLRPAVSVAAYE